MLEPIHSLRQAQERRQLQTLQAMNARTAQFGLYLTEPAMLRLVQRREEALRASGRVSFDGDLLSSLIWAFSDCPHLSQDTYEMTLEELMEAFYHFKQESGEAVSDTMLLHLMRRYFDARHGEITLLTDATFQELWQGEAAPRWWEEEE